MKQKLLMLTLLTLLVTALIGCGSTTGSDSTSADSDSTDTTTEESTSQSARYYNAADYVTLSDYTGLEVTVDALETITDDELQNYIDYILSSYTEDVDVTDRPAQEGDVVLVTSVGTTLDGEEFDNSGEDGYEVTIGGSDYIDGYAEGLVGASVGDVVEEDLVFPDDYSSTDLAGQEAHFTLTVISITETVTPELTDDFVLELDTELGTDYTTVEGFREGIREMLVEYAQETYDNDLYTAVMDLVIAGAQFEELPQELINYYNENIQAYYTSEAAYYGYDLETYVTSYYGITLDDFDAQVLELAESSAQEELAIQRIAELEGITVDDDTMNESLEQDIADAGLTTQEEYLGTTDIEEYRSYLVKQKVLQFLVENAVVSETAADDTELESVTLEELEDAEGTTETTDDTTTETDTTESTETTDGN